MSDFENQNDHDETRELAEKLKQDGWILDYELHQGDTAEDSGVFISLTEEMREAFIRMLDHAAGKPNSTSIH